MVKVSTTGCTKTHQRLQAARHCGSLLSFPEEAPLTRYVFPPQAHECDHELQLIELIDYKVYRGEDL
jgi:hypothetical protein